MKVSPPIAAIVGAALSFLAFPLTAEVETALTVKSNLFTYSVFDVGADLLPPESASPDDNRGSLSPIDFTDTKLKFVYRDETYGGALTFAMDEAYATAADIANYGINVFLVEELFGWVRPFAPVKVTLGIFENTDGISLYDHTIDDYKPGVFPFSADKTTNEADTAFKDGLLVDINVGPLGLLDSGVLQLYLGRDIDPRDVGYQTGDARSTRLGIRLIQGFFDVGTLAVFYKSNRNPVSLVYADLSQVTAAYTEHTFGAFFDYTARADMGVSLGYTGYYQDVDSDDVATSLRSGIDLRGTYASGNAVFWSHNNISFADNSSKDAFLSGSFFSLYDAFAVDLDIGNDITLTPEISNYFREVRSNAAGTRFDTLSLGVRLKKSLASTAAITCGLLFNSETDSILDGSTAIPRKTATTTTFAIPLALELTW